VDSAYVINANQTEFAPASATTWLDRLLQRWRARMALRELPTVTNLLDIGTHDGTVFRLTGASGVGIDPQLVGTSALPRVTFVKGRFPADLPAMPAATFDAATALAVAEHVPEAELATWATVLARLMTPNGVLVLTVPAPAVDVILHVLMRLRLVAGMEAHQHHGFRPGHLDAIFAAPMWRRRKHRRFQLGLNHLYVFERIAE
jgi:Methyltransferase domain